MPPYPSLRSPSGGTPLDIDIIYAPIKSAFNGLQFSRWHYRSIFIRLAVVATQSREITRDSDKIWPYSSSRSSKVIDLGVNRKPMYASFLPARRYASAGNSDRNVSVCPCVCLSVTRRYCVKTKKASGMISSPSGSSKTLVFCRQISSPNSKGFPPNGGLKQGSVWKIQRFSSFKRQYLENGSRYGQSHY